MNFNGGGSGWNWSSSHLKLVRLAAISWASTCAQFCARHLFLHPYTCSSLPPIWKEAMLSLYFVDEEIRFREHKRVRKWWSGLSSEHLSTASAILPSAQQDHSSDQEAESASNAPPRADWVQKRICQEEARCVPSSGLNNVHMAYFCTGPRWVSSG